jgi:hypothetical protein
MEPKVSKQAKKHFFIHSFPYLWQLEEGLRLIQKNPILKHLQLSVLGKVSGRCISEDRKILTSKKDLKAYWSGSLGPGTDLGLFCNPEIGSLFIAGPLATQFSHDLNGKVLGEMASGPYGVLLGLGISKKNAAVFLDALNQEHFLLMARGKSHQLDRLSELLKNPLTG